MNSSQLTAAFDHTNDKISFTTVKGEKKTYLLGEAGLIRATNSVLKESVNEMASDLSLVMVKGSTDKSASFLKKIISKYIYKLNFYRAFVFDSSTAHFRSAK